MLIGNVPACLKKIMKIKTIIVIEVNKVLELL